MAEVGWLLLALPPHQGVVLFLELPVQSLFLLLLPLLFGLFLDGLQLDALGWRATALPMLDSRLCNCASLVLRGIRGARAHSRLGLDCSRPCLLCLPHCLIFLADVSLSRLVFLLSLGLHSVAIFIDLRRLRL